MKKLSIFFLLLITTGIYGQSLRLQYNGAPVNNNDTVTISMSPFESDNNTFYVDVINVSSDNIVAMKVCKTILAGLEGTRNTFCVNMNCFDGDTSGRALTIYPGDTVSHLNDPDHAFHAEYYPQGIEGVFIIKYTFYNQNDMTDATGIILKFDSRTTSIKKAVSADIILKAMPNPAVDKVTIAYQLNDVKTNNHYLTLKSLTGAVLRSFPISNTEGKITVNLSGMAPGLYFYSIESNRKSIITRKLLIK